MFPTQTYLDRRNALKDSITGGLILLPGNGEAPMNYAGNTYPFRQDSTFRYFSGLNRPDLVMTICPETGDAVLFGDDLDLEDEIWMGQQPAVADLAQRTGAEYGGNMDQFREHICYVEVIHYLPPYREERRTLLHRCLNHYDRPSEALIRAVVSLRSVKSHEEIEELDRAVHTSMRMHAAARDTVQPGMTEHSVAGLMEGIAISAGGRLSYPAIVTRNGHILHNHDHSNTLVKGDLLLIDAGAESAAGYAGDITRTLCVGGNLSERQRPVYEIVSQAKNKCIEAIKPGVPFREIHDLASRIIVDGLKNIGLMRGNSGEAVAAGAHALFFPHGLGHMIGLDVHDMEDLGEDYVGYDEEFTRSQQFGTRNLRLGKRLREGYAITVEPGIYFIPVLIDKWKSEGLHTEFIDYSAVESYRDFGGIRLEDNVVVTADNCRVLGSV